MKAVVLGSGMMGRAIAYDLIDQCNFSNVTMIDKDDEALYSADDFLKKSKIRYQRADVKNIPEMTNIFQDFDVAISAVPYFFNIALTEIAIKTETHFIDLGGNNDVVLKQKSFHEFAKKNNVTIIPDMGLAPGLVSVITKDIVDSNDKVEQVNLRVGGLPKDPLPPLNYEIVFSPNGLINEYLEDAIILSNRKIQKKKSMTELEEIHFPQPFGKMEAFITSGGCSTLPYSYKNQISYLDYKTIRYPGHCERFKTMLDLGFGSTENIAINSVNISPRNVLIKLLETHLPSTGKDVVLLKVLSKCIFNRKSRTIEYLLIDYYDESSGFSAMARCTGFPVSITAKMLAEKQIRTAGVYCPEEIIPPDIMFEELKKRNIVINKKIIK